MRNATSGDAHRRLQPVWTAWLLRAAHFGNVPDYGLAVACATALLAGGGMTSTRRPNPSGRIGTVEFKNERGAKDDDD